MVLFSFGNDGKFTNEEYHAFRQRAKEASWSINEWGPIDIGKYDLETVDFGDGTNKRYYIVSRNVKGEVEEKPYIDLRDLKTHY